MPPRFQVTLREHFCKGCALCVQACRKEVLAMASHVNALGYRPTSVVAPERCSGCKACAMVCPDSVFTLYQLG